MSRDSFKTKTTLNTGKETLSVWSLTTLAKQFPGVQKLPFSLKILLENLLRNEDGRFVKSADIETLAKAAEQKPIDKEIAFTPARVLMQDFTGVPAVVDLAAMRDAMKRLGGDPKKINPLVPVDLVVDHSVQVDEYGNAKAFELNSEIEFIRNKERYSFLCWGQKAFQNFRVVPPETGIVHQVNLEYLAPVIMTRNGQAYPDTLVGTDSHTTMINGLGVLGWGVGGIEAEAAMLGQPLSMLIPEVIGFKLTGTTQEGITATDVVLTVTEILRKKGVVGKFVEFFGPGLAALPLADRATIANMAPEYGATMGFFPIDEQTLKYLELSGRSQDQIKLVETYAKMQGLFRDASASDPVFTEMIELNLNSIEPSMAGPKRPQDRIVLKDVKTSWEKTLPTLLEKKSKTPGATTTLIPKDAKASVLYKDEKFDLGHGAVVIAAITSCTNTSNPSVLIAAGLLAKKAVERGLVSKPWVKTSLAPGSKVVIDYLQKTGLMPYLEKLGFHLVGYGCTTCIGNSGPLPKPISEGVSQADLVVSAVLSGNRNFEGRVNPQVRANYLASPPLVVAYALAGNVNINITQEALGKDAKGQEVYLKEIWPSNAEIQEAMKLVSRDMFVKQYANVFDGDANWQSLSANASDLYNWDQASTYIKHPPYFETMSRTPEAIKDIQQARVLAVLGDSVTTDHISPAGNIAKTSPAAAYLNGRKVDAKDFNSYGARRGNDDVMVRGTFANIRLKNEMVPGVEGGVTIHYPSKEQVSIFDASDRYKKENVPLVIIAGKEYGSGSSRDWAAKGPALLGVKAVIAESYERIHRSNLVGMGVLPLQFKTDQTRQSLGLKGDETFSIQDIAKNLKPKQTIQVQMTKPSGESQLIETILRIDTPEEIEYYRNGGILPYVLRQLLA